LSRFSGRSSNQGIGGCTQEADSQEAKMRAIALILLLAPVCARGQDGETLKELLSGDQIPLTVAVKDLDAEWRRVAISTPDPGGKGSYGKERIYFTKGQTITRAQETFLIAYSPPAGPPI